MKLNSDTLKILVCCHKKTELPQNDIFLPIHAGASLSGNSGADLSDESLTDSPLNIQRDDECNEKKCDNISSKNKNYCELTAIYWAWKNIRTLYPNLKYIGLNHYRRFFIFGKTNRRITSIDYERLSDISFPIMPENLNLKDNTIIIPRGTVFNNTLHEHYCLYHHSDDYWLLKETIKNMYPDYYASFINYFEKNYVFLPYNMFIMPLSIFDDYCSWLFPILSEVEAKSNYKTYNDKQQRIFGYMAERLFGVYIFHNKLKKLELPVAFINPETAGTVHKTSLKKIIKTALRKKWNL
jgi:hypothetical protein